MDVVNFLNLEYIFLAIIKFFRNFDIVALLNALIAIIEFLRPITIILALFLFYVILYSTMRTKQVVDTEIEQLYGDKTKEAEPAQDTSLSAKWQEVMNHISSPNPSDWRLAILEADIMLDEILEKKGYQGDTIGDKLKSVDKSDMLTLQDAWTAHKVRNRIAHDGTDFKMNEREARGTIDLYKKVFEEFYHI